MTTRSFDRTADAMRPLTLTPHVSRHAEGSCMIECGYTKVLCTASVQDGVPPFKKNSGEGWITAEYGMLPRATGSRNRREAAAGKQTGRTQEIQRLIGRSLRVCADLKKLDGYTINLDCDVLEADGGTRTASITGAYVALHLACLKLMEGDEIKEMPLKFPVNAISCGIVGGEALLDLDYIEDSTAEVDANFVFAGDGRMIEIQGTAEGEPFSDEQLQQMLTLAKDASIAIAKEQLKATGT